MFHLTTTEDVESLFRQTESWDSLTRGVPFRESSWLGPWWRHLGGDKQANVVVARDDEANLRGLLPLYRSGGDTPGRTLAMMGDGDACSDYASVLARDEDVIEIAELMGRYLAEQASHPERGWDLIDLDGVIEGDASMTAFASGLKAGGATLHTQSRMSTWIRSIDSSWEEHLKHHGKTQRRRMRRWSEKIAENGPMQKLLAENDEQVDQLLGALIEMHQDRWNREGEAGTYADPQFRNFIFESAKEFCRRGRLYLTAVAHEGKTIGGELNFVGENRIMYCYSAGYDIDAADLEPGRILSTDTLLQMYRAELTAVDYMRGDEEYKKRLSDDSRRLLRIRAVAPTWLPRLRHAAWSTRFELTQWMRKQTGRTVIDVIDLGSSQ